MPLGTFDGLDEFATKEAFALYTGGTMKLAATATRIDRTVIPAMSLHLSRTPASHLVNVRWSLASACSADCTEVYRLRAIAIATKLVASCAIVASVAR